MQHTGDVAIAEAIAGFNINFGLHACGFLFGRHLQQAIGIHGKSHADTRCACGHGGNAAQFKSCQAAAVSHQIALALQDMNRQRGLPVFESGEILRHSAGYGGIARDDVLDQAAHGFYPQR